MKTVGEVLVDKIIRYGVVEDWLCSGHYGFLQIAVTHFEGPDEEGRVYRSSVSWMLSCLCCSTGNRDPQGERVWHGLGQRMNGVAVGA